MAIGPGKYDDICSMVRTTTNADGVVLIIFNRNKGSGFSVQADERLLPPGKLADVLEDMAKEIRKDERKI